MAEMRFAILRKFGEHEKIVLEYNEEFLKERFSRLTQENLPPLGLLKRGYKKEEVADALGKAFDSLISEFKQETIRIP